MYKKDFKGDLIPYASGMSDSQMSNERLINDKLNILILKTEN